jgi:hypothetical protein
MADLRPAARVPLLVLGMLSLVGGVLAGLARLDWNMPAVAANAAGWHGALMISAFLGTVISLERAVALGRGWAYRGAGRGGTSGGIGLLAAVPLSADANAHDPRRHDTAGRQSFKCCDRQVAHPSPSSSPSARLCWLIGNAAWLAGGALTAAVSWWLAFLVLTIAGERLELTRFLPTPALAQRLFFAIVGGILAGAALSLWQEDAGLALFSAGLLALAIWLLRYDIARRNAQQQGLVRFIALCLLSGYAWLVLAGLLGISGGFLPGHPWRDATLHAVGLGFVFSMIFGHAPIIFPAVVRVKIPYHPFFYLPLLVLHASLALRIFGGLGDAFPLRSEGGLLNAIALLLFIATMIASVVRGKRDEQGVAQ